MPYRIRFELDPHPFARGGSVAICAVSIMHVIQAVLLLLTHAAGNATPLRALLYVFWQFSVGLDAVAPLMMLTAALAFVGALYRLGWVRLVVFLPQHFFLGIMAIGGLWAAYYGAYLDGTVIPWEHILTDQMSVSVLFIVHSSAIVRRARDPNG